MERWLPSAEYLRECFSYDPESGLLTWKRRPRAHFRTNRGHGIWNGRYAGKVAGSVHRTGYIRLILDNKLRCAVHHVIWTMHTGEWPIAEMDHKNGDRADNRLENLRVATRQQNGWNTARRDWRDLPRGVQKANQKTGFVAGVTINGKRIHLGTFATAEEAHAAWLAAVGEDRGEFFRAD